MKNSTQYAAKVKKLLAGAKDGKAPEQVDRVRLMMRAILEQDTSVRHAEEALKRLEAEYVDLNEMRISPLKDLVDCLGRRFVGARYKAEMLTTALNMMFDRANSLSLDYLAEKPKREIRRALLEDLHLSHYAEAVVALYGFAGHAIPVDFLLAEALKQGDYVHAQADVADIQGFLERLVLSKDAIAVHESLRQFALQHAAKLDKAVAKLIAQAEQERAKAAADAKAKAIRLAMMPIMPEGEAAIEGDDVSGEEEPVFVEAPEPEKPVLKSGKAAAEKPGKAEKAEKAAKVVKGKKEAAAPAKAAKKGKEPHKGGKPSRKGK